MDVEYLQGRRASWEAGLRELERRLTEMQRQQMVSQGAIAEIDAQLNQGKLAAECVARLFEEPPMVRSAGV